MKRRTSGPRPLTGVVAMPGDKSISHRAALFAGLAAGRSTVAGINLGDDVRATLSALRAFGVGVVLDEDKGEVEIDGRAGTEWLEPDGVVDAGNSGTTIRVLLGVCSGIPGLCVLTGDASLRARPMLRVVAPLRQMGARIDGRAHGDRAPLVVRGGELSGIDFETTVASAQVKTAILLAGLSARGRTSVTEPATSRDHTERMLAAAGVAIDRDGAAVELEGGQSIAPRDWQVPGDISAAMFFVAGALLLPGSELEIADAGLNPTRTAALDVLQTMGAAVEVRDLDERDGEPVGTLMVKASELKGTVVDPAVVPRLIDEIPVLAVVATQAMGETVIKGAGELRVKESDRIAALSRGLRALGADVDELPDGLVIRGPTSLSGGLVESMGDHRIAMALAVAGLIASERVRVNGWACVDTSFPDFLEVLGAAQAGKR